MDKSCETCRWWLGGIYDCCRLNLEAECKGGEYQAWEARQHGWAENGEQARAAKGNRTA